MQNMGYTWVARIIGFMYDDTTYVSKYEWNINKNLHVYFIYRDDM